MVDTVRTLAALQALLANNTDQDISAQDVRDFLVSVYPPAPEVDRVPAAETTTSTSYTDLTTPGPSVTVDVVVSGILIVTVGAEFRNNVTNNGAEMSFTLSGANTLAASDERSAAMFSPGSNLSFAFSRTLVLTGLNAGSTTATIKYKARMGGTALFVNREIFAVAWPGTF